MSHNVTGAMIALSSHAGAPVQRSGILHHHDEDGKANPRDEISAKEALRRNRSVHFRRTMANLSSSMGRFQVSQDMNKSHYSGSSARRFDQFAGIAQQKRRQEISRNLLREDLQNLTAVYGYIPEFVCVERKADVRDIIERLRFLDSKLRNRVQSICDRFYDSQRRMEQIRFQCSLFCGLGKFVRLGIVREIWMEVAFFVIFTLCWQVYMSAYDFDSHFTAVAQDNIYYPGIVCSFLLSFFASDCMVRYESGCRYCFEMEKSLRDMAFDVLTKLSLDDETDSSPPSSSQPHIPSSLKKRYFKHEFRRMTQLLFSCAARDLNDSTLDEGELMQEDELSGLGCCATDAEIAVIRISHSQHGHIFRIYMIAGWLLNLIRRIEEEALFDEEGVHRTAEASIRDFKNAYMNARQIAYSQMPEGIVHLLWILTHWLNLVIPMQLVSMCKWLTWLPVLISCIAFFGIVRIAECMENPFGFDDDDIPIWQVGEHLDEDITLIMFYASLDEVSGENLYRGLLEQEHIYLDNSLGGFDAQ